MSAANFTTTVMLALAVFAANPPANAQSMIAKPGRYAIQRIASEAYDNAHQRCASTIGGQAALGQLVNDVAPVLAQHPSQPLNLALVWRTPYSVQFSASADGGFTWRAPITLKLNGCAGGPSVDNILDSAQVAIGADGLITVAALLRAPERAIERSNDAGEISIEVEPESTAVVVMQSNNGGLNFSSARLFEIAVTDAAPRLSHLALAAHPSRAGLSYVLVTRDNKAADGFGVRSAQAPLFASINCARAINCNGGNRSYW
jgi:hypothetical protein